MPSGISHLINPLNGDHIPNPFFGLEYFLKETCHCYVVTNKKSTTHIFLFKGFRRSFKTQAVFLWSSLETQRGSPSPLFFPATKKNNKLDDNDISGIRIIVHQNPTLKYNKTNKQ